MAEAWLERFKRSEFKGTQDNASFKGVPFIIKGAISSFGRRTIEHEFPDKDIPFSEDLGRRSRTYSVEGFVLGPNYLTQRDNLQFVCEEEGPGELIHPYYGILSVICKNIEIRDSSRENRIARFQAVFVEVGERIFPIAEADTVGLVDRTARVSLDSLRTPFEKLYRKISKPLVYSEGTLDVLDSGFDAIDKAKKLAGVSAQFNRQLVVAKNAAPLLIFSAGDLYDSLFDLITFGLLDDLILDARLSFEGFNGMIDFDPSIKAFSDDSDAIETLTQSLNVITMGLLLPEIDFDSRNEAENFRDIVFNKLDELQEDELFDDEVNQNVKDLRQAIVDDYDARLFTLARLNVFIPIETAPALAIAYSLYGDISQEQDIVDRNNIEHPGFVPGGQPIEILLDA